MITRIYKKCPKGHEAEIDDYSLWCGECGGYIDKDGDVEDWCKTCSKMVKVNNHKHKVGY